MSDEVNELIMAALHLEKAARELVEVANNLYDRAVTIAIHDAECMSRHVVTPIPVRADREEEG